jgi:hypothetical protein
MEVLAVVALGFLLLLTFAGFFPRLGIGLAIPVAVFGVRALAEPDGFLVEIVHAFGGLLVFTAVMMVAVAFGAIAGQRKHPPPPPPPQLPTARVISG